MQTGDLSLPGLDHKYTQADLAYATEVGLACKNSFFKYYFPANVLYKSIAGRYRPVCYPDGPITARYRVIKNAYWVRPSVYVILSLCICYRSKCPCSQFRWSSHWSSTVGQNAIKSPAAGNHKVPQRRYKTRRIQRNTVNQIKLFVCLCWGFTAQSTQWGHVEGGQFT